MSEVDLQRLKATTIESLATMVETMRNVNAALSDAIFAVAALAAELQRLDTDAEKP